MKKLNWNDPELWRRLARGFRRVHKGLLSTQYHNGICFAIKFHVKDYSGTYSGPAYDLLDKYIPYEGWPLHGIPFNKIRASICDKIAYDLQMEKWGYSQNH